MSAQRPTWREAATFLIDKATRDLPADTPLKERMRVVDAARPSWASAHGPSWPQKAWQAARRDYLVPFGYQPRTKSPPAAGPLPLFGEGGAR